MLDTCVSDQERNEMCLFALNYDFHDDQLFGQLCRENGIRYVRIGGLYFIRPVDVNAARALAAWLPQPILTHFTDQHRETFAELTAGEPQ